MISIGTYKTERNEYQQNKFSSSRFAVTHCVFCPISFHPIFLPFARVYIHIYIYTHKSSYARIQTQSKLVHVHESIYIKTSIVHDTSSSKTTGTFVVNIAEISLAFSVIPSTNSLVEKERERIREKNGKERSKKKKEKRRTKSLFSFYLMSFLQRCRRTILVLG